MKIAYFILLTLIMISCNNQQEFIPITFVFEKPLHNQTKYPPYFYSIAEPFTTKCGEDKFDILLKPIAVSRLDISNKEVATNAWYFEGMGENTVEFSKNWLSQYFKDTTVNAFLLEPTIREASVEQFLFKNKESCLIYSEDSPEPTLYDLPVYSKPQPLKKAMEELICKKHPENIYVLIVSDTKLSLTDTGGSAVAGNLGSDNPFQPLIDHSKSDEERLAEIDGIITKYFTSTATVTEYGSNKTIVEPAMPARDYMNKIALFRTLERIEIMEAEKDNSGKIWNIKVIEHHNTTN